jgi:ABC-type Fe3+ transport system permease subunit
MGIEDITSEHIEQAMRNLDQRRGDTEKAYRVFGKAQFTLTVSTFLTGALWGAFMSAVQVWRALSRLNLNAPDEVLNDLRTSVFLMLTTYTACVVLVWVVFWQLRRRYKRVGGKW